MEEWKWTAGRKEWGAIIEYLNYFIFIIVGGQNQNSPNVYLCIYTHSGENIYLIPCWFCTFAHWQRNDQSIILMLGLFEQWETEQQQQQKIQKNVFQKSYKLICILMSQICLEIIDKILPCSSGLIPHRSHDHWNSTRWDLAWSPSPREIDSYFVFLPFANNRTNCCHLLTKLLGDDLVAHSSLV